MFSVAGVNCCPSQPASHPTDEGDSDLLAPRTGPSGGVCLAGSMRSTSVQELEQAGVPARLCLLQTSR